MKIVIDIPDAYYKSLQDISDEALLMQDLIIKYGKPLSKGHGRIIDYGYVVDAIDDWINAEEYCYTNGTDYLRNRIRNIPTIIEADKECEE